MSDRFVPVLLIGCVSKKDAVAQPAEDLYRSALFRFRRAYARRSGWPWLILSALYGLVDPRETLEPYDLKLTSLPAADRARWGNRVVDQLDTRFGPLGGRVFEVHAGAPYVDPIEPLLVSRGAQVRRPLARLPIGRQLQWYKRSLMAVDARKHLESLVGQTIRTLSGKPNTVIAVCGDEVIVGTERSPKGQPVEIRWVQDAIDKLHERGELAIEVSTVGYRSAFVGAVLATLPDAVVVAGTRRIRLSR